MRAEVASELNLKRSGYVQSETGLGEGIAIHWIMRLASVLLGIIAFSAGNASPALAQRFSFERSFDVTGPSALDVSTIRGKIDVAVGEPGRVVVTGTATVRVDWNVPADAAAIAQRVADNPPVRRDGETIHAGSPSDPAELRAVTVSYQIRVPPDTAVTTTSESGETTVRGIARPLVIRTTSGAIDVTEVGDTAAVTTGSGAVIVDGVGGALSITTNSSSITARALLGDVRIRTKSGAVEATLTGEGDADVETGSSAIGLSGIRGGATTASRSGRIAMHGVPRRDWSVSTGSGGVEIAIASSAPFTLDASTASGSVKVAGGAVEGSVAKRNVAGSIAGGGPTVKVVSRSGSIVVRLGAAIPAAKTE